MAYEAVNKVDRYAMKRRSVLKLLGLAPLAPGLFREAVVYQHPISLALAVENFINCVIEPEGGHVDIIKDKAWSKEYRESIMDLVGLAAEQAKQPVGTFSFDQ